MGGDGHVVLEKLSRALSKWVRNGGPGEGNARCERRFQASTETAGGHAGPGVAGFRVVADAAVEGGLVSGHAGEAGKSLHVVHLVALALSPLGSSVLEPNLKKIKLGKLKIIQEKIN